MLDQEVADVNHDKLYLESMYKTVFANESGKFVLQDIENVLLRDRTFYTEDLKLDSLLRDGARRLLVYIYHQLGDSNPMNQNFKK